MSQKSLKGELLRQSSARSEKDKEIEMKLQEEEIEKQKTSLVNRIEMFRVKLKKFMNSNAIGHAYSEILLVLSIFSTAQFVYSTYAKTKSFFFTTVEESLAVVFGFDWILSFFLADHKIEFVSRYFSNNQLH